MSTKNGVVSYKKGSVTLDIFFPDSKVCCNYCLLCRYEDAYKRYSCRATDEWLLSPFTGIGARCPIKFEQESSDEYLSVNQRDS